MLNWINFLHLYQPPQQNEYIFHEVARTSYFEIAKFFDEYDGLKLTMNLSGSLLEQLIGYRYDQLLSDFVRAFSSGELELVGSAMYHPILPLLPEREIERQILLDEKMKQRVFGSGYVRRGFYLPEMAYSPRVAAVLDRMGFAWIILDEISYDGQLDRFDKGRVYRIADTKLQVVFRDRRISNGFVPEKIKELSGRTAGETSIITATDGEMYGHHHQNFYDQTRAAFCDGNIRSLHVSEFIAQSGGAEREEVRPVCSSWESQAEELARGIPFSFWSSPGNLIQERLWDFTAFALREMEAHQADEKYAIARALLDKALSSCHFWAASGKQSVVWKDTIWNPDAIEQGNRFTIQALRSLARMDPPSRMEAEGRYLEITRLIWDAHWHKFYNSEKHEE